MNIVHRDQNPADPGNASEDRLDLWSRAISLSYPNALKRLAEQKAFLAEQEDHMGGIEIIYVPVSGKAKAGLNVLLSELRKLSRVP